MMALTIQRRMARFAWCYAIPLLGILSSGAAGKEPVCLDKTIRNGGAACVLFSPDGKWLAAEMHSEIVVWDFASREKVATRSRENVAFGDTFTTFAFMPDSQGIIYADGAGRVCLWDGSAGWADGTERELVGQLVGKDGRLKSGATGGGNTIGISPDGRLLATPRGMKPTKVVLTEIATGREIGLLDVDRAVDSILFAEEGKTLVVSTGGTIKDKAEVQFWDMDTQEPRDPLRVPVPARTRLGYGVLAFLSPTEKTFAFALDGQNVNSDVCLYEPSSGRWTPLAGNCGIMGFLSFSPDGRLLAVPTHYGRYVPAMVRVYDLSAGTFRRLDCPAGIAKQNIAFYSAAFSRDGRYLVGGLYHPQVAVCIWDLEEDPDKSRAD